MTRIIRITDGTDTIDFTDASSGYTLLNHTPAVARREPGNPELYSRVVEEMEISVSGSTRAQITERVDLLTEMIERARRLWAGEALDPVLYQYQAEGSALSAPLEALVIGPPPGQSAVILPAGYDSDIAGTQVGSQGDPLVFRFLRRGALLDEEESSQTTASIEAGEVATHTFSGGALNYPSPMDYEIDRLEVSFQVEKVPQGFILANRHDYIMVFEAEDVASGVASTVDESANFARGGDVARFSSAGGLTLAGGISGEVTPSDPLYSSPFWIVFLVARSSASDTAWRLQMTMETGFDADDVRATSRAISGFAETVPTALCLGTIANPGRRLRSLVVSIERQTGSGSLDIDYLVVSDPTLPEFGLVQLLSDSRPSTQTSIDHQIYIKHRLLSLPSAEVYVDGVAGKTMLAYRGNPLLHSLSQETDVILIFTGEDKNGNYWRAVGDSALLDDLQLTATRRPAYLVPR